MYIKEENKMKVVVISKTGFGIIEYDNVTAISKAGAIITITYGTNSTATANTETYIVRIMES